MLCPICNSDTLVINSRVVNACCNVRRRRKCIKCDYRFNTIERVRIDMNEKLKQVIVMRSDLNMRKGKMIVQGAHASMKIFFDRVESINKKMCLNITQAMMEWMTGIFTKICVKVDSERELLEIREKAISLGLPVALIEDNGLTEFKGVVTKTCLAIGPDDSEKIDQVTGHLQLL